MEITAPREWTGSDVKDLCSRTGLDIEQLAAFVGWKHAMRYHVLNGTRKPGTSARRLLDMIEAHGGIPSQA